MARRLTAAQTTFNIPREAFSGFIRSWEQGCNKELLFSSSGPNIRMCFEAELHIAILTPLRRFCSATHVSSFHSTIMPLTDLSLSFWALVVAAVGAGVWVNRARKMARHPPGPKGIAISDDLIIAI